MLRLFVTGDNHIGLKYTSHEHAAILAAERLEAFKGMVAAANKEQCDLFVITGDLFENTYSIAKRDIAALLDILCAFRGTVAVLPGNHDYYDQDVRLWQYFRDAAAGRDNVLLMNEYRPYMVSVGDETAVLYPALCTAHHSATGENNLGWIKQEDLSDGSVYHIGIAHGAVEGETIDKEGQYFLMSRQELEDIPVDVWLIGHTHVPFPRDLTEDWSSAGRIFNAGTHVQTDVACNTEGQCVIVQLQKGKAVLAKRFVSGRLRFYRKELTLRAENMENTLDRALADLDDHSVVELILTGAVTEAEYEHRTQMLDEKLSRFIEGHYRDSDLSKQISKELIDAQFAETSFSASLLTALLDNPKEAQLAYELLKELKEGK